MRRALVLLCAAFLGTARAEEVPAATASDYGGVGLIEMRNARMRPDGVLEAGAAIRRQRRFWFLNFQALPWLETTFRVTERLDATAGAGTTSDRALDLKIRLLEEDDWLPAVAVGFQDVIGTGLYAGEYLVASKRWWDLDFTLGLGWGRLGTGADFDNPARLAWDGFATRPRSVGQGGTVRALNFYRGERAALFGGVEWSVPPLPTPWGAVEGLRAKLEWSGDALRDERGGFPARAGDGRGRARTRLNAGLQWSNDWLDLGLHFVHGTDLLLRASLRLDPNAPPEAPRPPPPAMEARPPAANGGEGAVAARLFPALRAAGFRPEGFALADGEARIAVSDGRFRTLAQVAGRVLRAAQPHLPPAVERVLLSWRREGVEIARLLLLRRALEDAAAGAGSAEEVFAGAMLLPAGGEEPFADGVRAPPLALDWFAEPRLRLLLGDPSRTLRWEAAAVAGARVQLGAGFALAGGLRQTLAGNLDDAPPSDSLLPHVRSDAGRYAREGRNAAIPTLYAERLWSPAPDVFARATAGYLEPMFAGVSGELLWRPHDRPYAVGLDLSYVRQRDFDQRFGLRDYGVATGHLSVYADLPWWNLYGVVRAGRYLAGDWGATVELGRRFDSGIEVGAFATLTNVPFSRFGEGSFDKGIFVRIPLDLFGVETRGRATALIRPVQRDGGQRLAVDNPLWDVTRDGRAEALARGTPWFLR